MQLQELEKQKFGALGGKATVFVNSGAGTQEGVQEGYTFGKGMSLGKATL